VWFGDGRGEGGGAAVLGVRMAWVRILNPIGIVLTTSQSPSVCVCVPYRFTPDCSVVWKEKMEG